jgi:hypothetical protein
MKKRKAITDILKDYPFWVLFFKNRGVAHPVVNVGCLHLGNGVRLAEKAVAVFDLGQ